MAYADSPSDPPPVIVPAGAIEPVGFAAEEALLPWPARSFSGFRLLTEYFAFPEKFLFVDFTRMEAKTLLSGGSRIEIFVYLDRALPELERTVGADALALGCMPMINLFPQRCEPIRLTHTETEYRVVPDARRPAALEVWQVERVRETAADGGSRPWRPFYRLTHADPDADTPGGFYHAARRDTAAAADRQRGLSGAARSRLRSGGARPTRCCRSMRCASTATCRRLCRSAAAIPNCGWSRACRRSRTWPA